MDKLSIALISVVVGGIVGAAGAYLGAVKIARKQRLIEAGRRLREAFIGDITAIQINQLMLRSSALKGL